MIPRFAGVSAVTAIRGTFHVAPVLNYRRQIFHIGVSDQSLPIEDPGGLCVCLDLLH
jgi:hypothetical protein